MIRRLSTLQLTFDIVVAGFCVLVRAILPLESPAGWLMLLLMGGALAIRRLSPGIALGVAWLGALIQMAGLLPPDPANLAILAVLFATARYGTPAVRWLGLCSAVAGSVIAAVYFVGFTSVGAGSSSIFAILPQMIMALVFSLGAALAVLVLSWTTGLLMRTWDIARANRRAAQEAEREVAVEQERNRIARDMHDVVAHSLAVVIAQADGARYIATTDPAATQEALGTIATTAREALTDVRGLLAQLRHNQSLGPQPALADLDSLIDQLRASGLDVDVVEHGDRPVLPLTHQLAIYRIVQESLTNALRHGNAAGRVALDIEWGADAASLTITNRRRSGATASPHGHGLTGMRERAALVGGSLEAGAVGDEFVVRAGIPVPVAEVAA